MAEITGGAIRDVLGKSRRLSYKIEEFNRRFDTFACIGEILGDLKVKVYRHEAERRVELQRQVELSSAPSPPLNQQAGNDRFPIPIYSGECSTLPNFLKTFLRVGSIVPVRGDLKSGLVRVEELNKSLDGTNGSHALAAGFKARSGGQSWWSEGRGSRNSGGRGKRDGRDCLPNQRQPQYQPRHQHEQSAHRQRHQQHQRQVPQQQYQWYHPRHQAQRPAQHSGGWGPSRVCFRCSQHGHFMSECRAVPPIPNTRLPGPYVGAQAATYSYSGDYANFESRRPPPLQSATAPPDPHGQPVPSVLSSSSFTNQTTLAQFSPPAKLCVPSASNVKQLLYLVVIYKVRL